MLEDHARHPVQKELVAFINDLDIEEQIDLETLTRLGPGDMDLEDWKALRSETSASHHSHSAIDLLDIRLLSDYLEEALSQFGESCEDLHADRLQEG